MTHRHLGLRATLIVVALAAISGGCNLLIPLAIIGNPKQKIAPEYDKLAGSRVLVLVWADSATLFDYPHVRFELASHVGNKLAEEMSDVEIVDPVKVADYRERHPGASLDPAVVGKHFDADRVIYLELLRFQIRDPDAPDFLRAHLEASVAVHDLEADPDEPSIFHLKPVDVVHPEKGGVQFASARSVQLRQTAYVLFAEKVARKFYGYEEEL